MEKKKKIEAGRELDAQVAQHIFGWRWYNPPGFCSAFVSPDTQKSLRAPEHIADAPTNKNQIGLDCSIPPYSTEISAVWNVIEWLNNSPKFFFELEGLGSEGYNMEIHTDNNAQGMWRSVADIHALTAPLAICLAALKAVEATKTVEVE